MLSKKTFIEAISAIKRHSEIMDELRVPLRKLGDFPLSLDIDSIHRTALLDVLKETTGDASDWISWWLYEDVDKIVEWEEDGQRMQADLTEVGALYEFLLANVENAESAALPLTTLSEDCFGKPRQAIEKHDFLLFFDACLKHINVTGSTLYICEEGAPKYVLMSAEHYADLNGDSYKELGHFFCPHCNKELRVMYTSENKEKGGIDVIAHCENCLRDWAWHRDSTGRSHEMQRHFWG